MQKIRAFFLLSFSVAVLVVAGFLCQALRSISNAAGEITQATTRLDAIMRGTSSNLNALLIQAALTADQVRQASAQQREYWRLNSIETGRVLAHTDEAVRGIGAAVKHADGAIVSASVGVNTELDSLDAATHAISLTALQLKAILGDGENRLDTLAPEVTNIAHGLDATSVNVAAATKSLADASNDIAKTTAYYERQLTTPQSFAKSMLLGALDITYKVANVWADLFKPPIKVILPRGGGGRSRSAPSSQIDNTRR
jgi:uncharacterized protein YoxC